MASSHDIYALQERVQDAKKRIPLCVAVHLLQMIAKSALDQKEKPLHVLSLFFGIEQQQRSRDYALSDIELSIAHNILQMLTTGFQDLMGDSSFSQLVMFELNPILPLGTKEKTWRDIEAALRSGDISRLKPKFKNAINQAIQQVFLREDQRNIHAAGTTLGRVGGHQPYDVEGQWRDGVGSYTEAAEYQRDH